MNLSWKPQVKTKPFPWFIVVRLEFADSGLRHAALQAFITLELHAYFKAEMKSTGVFFLLLSANYRFSKCQNGSIMTQAYGRFLRTDLQVTVLNNAV